MDRSDYWVQISTEAGTCGAGFLLTRRYVLTAAHCLREARVGDRDEVTVAKGTDTTVGRVVQVNSGHDVALVKIRGGLAWTVLDLAAGRCAKGDPWFAPYRPSPDRSELKGSVLADSIDFQCRGGDLIEALELEVRQLSGGYDGYSGSPVERDGPVDSIRSVVGMLIEQDPHRTRPGEATNVLFAVTVQHAMHALDLLAPPMQWRRSTPQPDRPASTRRIHDPVPSEAAEAAADRFSRARAAIEEIERLVETGLLDPAEAADHFRFAIREATRLTIAGDPRQGSE